MLFAASANAGLMLALKFSFLFDVQPLCFPFSRLLTAVQASLMHRRPPALQQFCYNTDSMFNIVGPACKRP